MISICFDNVSFELATLNDSQKTITNHIVNFSSGGKIARNIHDIEVVKVINNLSFKIFQGDIIGIFGHNGAGKSTLLRLIAGIYKQTSGIIKRNGTIKMMFDPSAGIDPELSGYDNIIRIGLLQGYTYKEIKELSTWVENFSGLGPFLTQPTKTYSSGMLMRLSFSVAICGQAEILIIDEAIGTGDEEFSGRVSEKIKELISRSKCVLIASHDLNFLKENCNRFFFIEKGALNEVKEPDYAAVHI